MFVGESLPIDFESKFPLHDIGVNVSYKKIVTIDENMLVYANNPGKVQLEFYLYDQLKVINSMFTIHLIW